MSRERDPRGTPDGSTVIDLNTWSHSNNNRESYQGAAPIDIQDSTSSRYGSSHDSTLDHNSAFSTPPPPPPKRHPLPRRLESSPHTQTIDLGLSDKEEARQRINGNIAFACFVFWCCNAFFGAIAFFVAISSRDATAKEARRLGNITLVINVIGIILSWILVTVFVALWWYGMLYVSFAPWRISHFYGTEAQDNGLR